MIRVAVFISLFFVSHVVCSQHTAISLGPTFSFSEMQADRKDKTGIGGSAEFYHRLFRNSGFRVFTGLERFQQPGVSYDRVRYLSLRAGYQHTLLKNKLHVWTDAGIANLRFPSGDNYNEFTFSAGGGYTRSISKRGFLQLQAFYVYTDNVELFDAFDPVDNYGWVTFRVAYGIRFGGRERSRGP